MVVLWVLGGAMETFRRGRVSRRGLRPGEERGNQALLRGQKERILGTRTRAAVGRFIAVKWMPHPGSLCPISVHPAVQKVPPCLHQAQNKGQRPKARCREKRSPVESMSVPIWFASLFPPTLWLVLRCWVPAAALGRERRNHGAGMSGVSACYWGTSSWAWEGPGTLSN